MILRVAVAALLAFMTLPTLVVIGVSFNPTAILSFPPAGLSLRCQRSSNLAQRRQGVAGW